MTYPDCPTCGTAVVHVETERVIHVVPGPGGFDHRVPSVPVGYSFEPCGHRITDRDQVEAYTTAARASLTT